MRYLIVFLFFLTASVSAQTFFTDQDQIPDWGELAVSQLESADIISGNADGSLDPLGTINRAEFLKLLTLATETPLIQTAGTRFNDVKTQDWFFPYVTTALQAGWIDGYPDGTFRPGGLINRAEIAKLLVEAFDFTYQTSRLDQFWFDGYVRALSDRELLPYDAPINRLDPAVNPTRIEVFEQLYRLLRQQGKFTNDSGLGPKSRRELSTVLPTGQVQVTPTTGDERFLTFTADTPKSKAKLNVSSKDAGTKTAASAGQGNVTLLNLDLTSTGSTDLKGLQIRRVGNGDHTDFAQLWIEEAGIVLSQKVTPQSDFTYIQLTEPLSFRNTLRLQIKALIHPEASSGSSSRWVLFLPDWIDSSAQSAVGLFPIGGKDISID